MEKDDATRILDKIGDVKLYIGELNGSVKALSERVDAHEKHDSERHQQLLDLHGELRRRIDKVEDDADATARRDVEAAKRKAAELEAKIDSKEERAEQRVEKAKDRRLEIVKTIAPMVVGAILALAMGAGAHAMGIQGPTSPAPAVTIPVPVFAAPAPTTSAVAPAAHHP